MIQPETASAKNKDVEAAIAAGVVGIAVGAALSHKHHHSPQVYYPGYQPPYAPGGYNPYFARAFSPAPGVMCYDAQRACYDADGTFSNKWMRRIYGR
jgi:hypothetical protein